MKGAGVNKQIDANTDAVNSYAYADDITKSDEVTLGYEVPVLDANCSASASTTRTIVAANDGPVYAKVKKVKKIDTEMAVDGDCATINHAVVGVTKTVVAAHDGPVYAKVKKVKKIDTVVVDGDYATPNHAVVGDDMGSYASMS